MIIAIVGIISGTLIALAWIVTEGSHASQIKKVNATKIEQLSIKVEDLENQLKASNARIIELENDRDKLKSQ